MTVWVNGEQIQEAAIRQERRLLRERLRQEWPAKSPREIESKAREWALENLIERILLRQAAWEFAMTSAPSDGGAACFTGIARGSLGDRDDPRRRIETFLKHLTQDVPKPTAREVSDYYRKNGKLFFLPERVRASHIVKNIEEGASESESRLQIEKAERALLAGNSFAETADEYSDCPGSGGDLGWFSRGEMVDEFEAVVFALKPSQVSPIFRSPFGFHLVQLHQRKAAGIPPLREVYHLIEENIIKRGHEELLARFLDKARAKADIRHMHSTYPGTNS